MVSEVGFREEGFGLGGSESDEDVSFVKSRDGSFDDVSDFDVRGGDEGGGGGGFGSWESLSDGSDQSLGSRVGVDDFDLDRLADEEGGVEGLDEGVAAKGERRKGK